MPPDAEPPMFRKLFLQTSKPQLLHLAELWDVHVVPTMNANTLRTRIRRELDHRAPTHALLHDYAALYTRVQRAEAAAANMESRHGSTPLDDGEWGGINPGRTPTEPRGPASPRPRPSGTPGPRATATPGPREPMAPASPSSRETTPPAAPASPTTNAGRNSAFGTGREGQRGISYDRALNHEFERQRAQMSDEQRRALDGLGRNFKEQAVGWGRSGDAKRPLEPERDRESLFLPHP